MFIPIPRLRRPTTKEFGRFVRQRLPVIIEGALDGWPALSTWTFDRLRSLGDGVEVRVQSRRSERADDFEYRDVAFAEFIDSIRSCTGRDYLASFPLFDSVPGLAKDIEVPHYAPARTVPPRVFIGPRRSFSPLHYDLGHGLSAQVLGTKRIIVVEFRRRDFVMHQDLRKPGWLSNPTDVEGPSGAGPGGLTPSRRWECTPLPGDLVFLPSRRHHFVRSLEDTVSISFFWHPLAMRIVRRLMAARGRSVV